MTEPGNDAGASETPPAQFSDEVLDRLRNFKGVSTFKKAAMNMLIKTVNEQEF